MGPFLHIPRGFGPSRNPLHPALQLPFGFKVPKHPDFDKTFNGSEVKFAQWYDQFSIWLNTCNPMAQWVIHLLGDRLLKGRALQLWRGAVGNFTTCEEALAWLRNSFHSKLSVVECRDRLKSAKMRPDEKPEGYMIRFQRLRQQLQWAFANAQAHEKFDPVRDRTLPEPEILAAFEKGMTRGLFRRYMESGRPRTIVASFQRVYEVIEYWDRLDLYGVDESARREKAQKQRAYAASTDTPKKKDKKNSEKKKPASKGSSEKTDKPAVSGDARPANPRRFGGKAKPTDKCRSCGNMGHWARECRSKKKDSPKQQERSQSKPKEDKGGRRQPKPDDTCNCCGNKGHWAKECPMIRKVDAYRKRRPQTGGRRNSRQRQGARKSNDGYVTAGSPTGIRRPADGLKSRGLAKHLGVPYGGMAPQSAPVVWKELRLVGFAIHRGMYDTGCSYNFLNDEVKEDFGDKLIWVKMTHPLLIDTAGNDGCQESETPQEKVKLRLRAAIDVFNPVHKKAFTTFFWHLPGKFKFIFGRGIGKFHRWGPFDEADFEVVGAPDIPTSALEVDGDAFAVTAHCDGSLFYDGSSKDAFVTEAPYEDASEKYSKMPDRSHLDAVKLTGSEQSGLDKIVDDCPDLFAKSRFDCGQIPGVQFRILLKDDNYVHFEPPRRLAFESEKEVKAQVNEMLRKDFCEPSDSPIAHGVLLRTKKDGSQRLCIDYRPLNKHTVDDRWPLPDIQDLLHRVAGCHVFSALDMASAYNHVSIHPDDRAKTAFITREGLFQLKVMSFGFKTAPPFFQRVLSRILRGIHNILVYLDDILVYTKTVGEHLTVLRKVFKKLSEANIKLKLPKCTLLHHRLEYLGHILSTEGLSPNPEYIEKCLRSPKPESRKDLQRFVGILNWVAIYVPLLSLLLAPLTELLKSRFATRPLLSSWKPVHDVAFRRCLKAVGDADFLRHPDPTKQFYIFCDSSLYACGAVLMQEYNPTEISVGGRLGKSSNGSREAEEKRQSYLEKLKKKRSVFVTEEGTVLWPVGFASHKFTETERRYHIVDLEIFAILLAIRVWSVWLRGRHFVVFTDAKMAKHFLQSAQSEGRHARWQAQLMGYHMTVKSVKGEDNVPADWMSREQQWDSAEATDAFWVGGEVHPGLVGFELRPSSERAALDAGRALILHEVTEAYPVTGRFPLERRPRRGSKKAKAWARDQRKRQRAKLAKKQGKIREAATEISVGGKESAGTVRTVADRGAGSVNRVRALKPKDVPLPAVQAVARESTLALPSNPTEPTATVETSEQSVGGRKSNGRRPRPLAPKDKERLAALRLQANLVGNLALLDKYDERTREERKEDEVSEAGDDIRRAFAMLREESDFTSTFDVARIALEQEEDIFIRAIRRSIEEDNFDAYSLPPKYRERLKKKEFELDTNLVMLKPGRLLVPPTLRRQFLSYFHDSAWGGGHGGAAATYKAMRGSVYWPGMREDVNLHVLSCLSCQKGKPNWRVDKQGLRIQVVVNGPLELLHVDTFELPESSRGNRFGVVMIDHHSGFMEVAPMKGFTSYETALAILSEWVCRWGLPRKIHSDRGSEYLNEISGKMAELCGFALDFTSGWSPQANGKAENAVKYLKTTLRVRSVDKPWEKSLRTKKHSEWDRLIPFIVMEKNTSLHPTHGYTPYEVFTGRQLRKPRMLAFRASKEKLRSKTPAERAAGKQTVSDFISTIQASYRRINSAARENYREYRLKVQSHLDKGRTPHKFVVGDKALVRVEGLVGTERKLTPPYVGPFTVTAVGAGGNTVTLDGGRNAGRSIHVQKCRKWTDRSPIEERSVGRPRKKKSRAKKKKKASEDPDANDL